MPDTIEANPRAIMGGNSPPLAELLADETALLETRADALVAASTRAVVTDRDTAAKATTLAGMIKDHVKAIEEWHEPRKKPFLEAGRAVDARKNALVGKLATFDARGRVAGGPLFAVLAMVDQHRRDEEAKADAERRRLEEEARVEREKAAAAQRAQAEAEAREAAAAREAAEKVRKAELAAQRAGDQAAQEAAARARADQQRAEAEASERRMAAELAQRQADDRAAELSRQAAASVAAPIDTGLGVKASSRKVTVVVIDDLRKATGHCLKVAETEMRETVQKIFDRLARAKIRDLPGATVREDTATTIRSA